MVFQTRNENVSKVTALMKSGLTLDQAYQKSGMITFDMPKENKERPFITIEQVARLRGKPIMVNGEARK